MSHRLARSCSLALALWAAAPTARAMPLPPGERGELAPRKGNKTIRARVRRIDQLHPTSVSAPMPQVGLAGEHRVLIVLMETPDAHFAAGRDAAWFNRRFFGPAPSLADYYAESSYGRYRLSGEVVGPFLATQPLASYAYDQSGDNKKVARLIAEAFAAAAGKVDLTAFDRFGKLGQPGGDGFVDHFGVVFPGVGGGSGRGTDAIFRPIWPHRGSFDDRATPRLAGYFTLSDAAPIGAFVHEFGHDIGLPDLYDRDDSSHGIGDWCTMASGSWLGDGEVPAQLSAWAKMKMGWLRPVNMTRSRTRVEIPAAESTPFAIRIPIGRIDAKEYFLVENRQPIGYDAALPDHGLLVWHIDERAGSNDDENVKLVDLEEPSATQDLDVLYRDQRPDGADTFRTGRRNRFDKASNPSSRSNDGRDTGVSINDISLSGAVMLADFEVPELRDPGGEAHRLMQDNYHFGPFSAVSLGVGGESLVRYTATPGGYQVYGFEALLMSRARLDTAVSLRVYDDDSGKPGKARWARRVPVQLGDEPYVWLKVQVDDPSELLLGDGQAFWVGLESHDKATGLAHNPASLRGTSSFRTDRKSALRQSFGPGRAVPDLILRVDGYGFIGVPPAAAAPPPDETDPLVARMRQLDARLDGGDPAAATAGYLEVLAAMEQQGEAYATWIPVLHNSLGVAAYQAKDYVTAIDFFQRSLRRAQLAGDRHAEADILENIGETHFHKGDLAGAAVGCGRAEALNADRPGRLMESLYWLGRIAAAGGHGPEAAAFFDRVVPLVEKVFAEVPKERQRWEGRLQRARAGTAVGEDLGEEAAPRLVQERREERAIETGKVREEDTNVWRVDLTELLPDGVE